MSEKQKKKLPVRKLIFAGAAVFVVILLALLELLLPFDALLPGLAIPPREDAVRLHFVDVGQGDCIIVEFPEGDILVVDGGSGGFRSENHLIRYIKGLHPTSVSVMATHSDADHCAGLTYVLRAFDVERCYMPLIPADTEEYRDFAGEAEAEGCEVLPFTRYDVIARDGGYLTCISPRSQEDSDNDDASTVLYLSFGGVRALLCGDISAQREELLAREYALPLGDGENVLGRGEYPVRLEDIDLVKAAHHGSANSSSEEWLSLLRPRTLIVTCGRGNSYRHPAEDALARFRAASPAGEIYRTDELGDIIFTMKEGTAPIVLGGEI